MAKKEIKLRAVVAPTETVIVSAYDENGKADACTLAFYMVSSHIPPCVTIAINATQKRKTLRDIDCEKPTTDWHYADFAALVDKAMGEGKL